MASAYTDITFSNAPNGITAMKLNLLRDDLSTAIAAAGSGGGTVSGTIIWGETPSGSINGVNNNFTSANLFVSNSLSVFLNGLRQRRIADYAETGANSFSFVQAPLSGDSVSVDYMKS